MGSTAIGGVHDVSRLPFAAVPVRSLNAPDTSDTLIYHLRGKSAVRAVDRTNERLARIMHEMSDLNFICRTRRNSSRPFVYLKFYYSF